MMEFHISRNARERYQFAETLFSYTGNVVFANMPACREFAHRMNQVRDAERHPDRAVHAGKLYAMGLIDEASHVLMARYREQFDPEVMTAGLNWFAGAGRHRKARRDAPRLRRAVSRLHDHSRPVKRPASGSTAKPTARPTAPPPLKNCSCSGPPIATLPSVLLKNSLKTAPLAEKTVYRQVTQRLPEYFATRPLIPDP